MSVSRDAEQCFGYSFSSLEIRLIRMTGDNFDTCSQTLHILQKLWLFASSRKDLPRIGTQ